MIYKVALLVIFVVCSYCCSYSDGVVLQIVYYADCGEVECPLVESPVCLQLRNNSADTIVIYRPLYMDHGCLVAAEQTNYIIVGDSSYDVLTTGSVLSLGPFANDTILPFANRLFLVDESELLAGIITNHKADAVRHDYEYVIIQSGRGERKDTTVSMFITLDKDGKMISMSDLKRL